MADVKQYEIHLKDGVSKDYIVSLSDSVVYRIPSNDKLMVVNLTLQQYQRILDEDIIEAIMDIEEHDLAIEDQDTRAITYRRHDPIPSSSATNYLTHGNWGLIRHSNDGNITLFNQETTGEYTYNYTGAGVDLIILASAMFYLGDFQKEFTTADGVDRIQRFQWNTLTGLEEVPTLDYDTVGSSSNARHAEAVAYIAAGKRDGWATESNIYIVDRETIDSSLWHECARRFHLDKRAGLIPGVDQNRPTVVVSAYGYRFQGTGNVHSIKFREQPESRRYCNNDIAMDSRFKACTNFGLHFFNTVASDQTKASIGLRADELTDAGVINVAAAGNFYTKQALPGNIDYNNHHRVQLSSDTLANFVYYYNREQPTLGRNGLTSATISCAALSSSFNWNTDIYGTKETLTHFSDRGNRTDCCAAGDNILFRLFGPGPARGSRSQGGRGNYSYNATGTSFASPQIAGMACLVLEKYPTTTPMQMRKFFREIAISSEKLHDSNISPLANTNHFGDPVYFDDSTGLQGYSGNIAYLDPTLPFDPSTITDTTIVNEETTAEGRLNFTIDEINTKLASI